MSDWFERRMRDPKFAQVYRIECFVTEALCTLDEILFELTGLRKESEDVDW